MLSNLKNQANFRFSNLLYLNFIVMGKHNVDEAAKAWWPKPIHRDTLYKKIRGANPFTVDDLPGLTRAIGSPEYLEFVSNQCGYTIIPLITNKKAVELISQISTILQRATNGGKSDE